MDSKTLGAGFFMVGVGMVVISGFLLRRSKEQNKAVEQTSDSATSRQLIYTWVGRVGTALAILGFLVALRKG